MRIKVGVMGSAGGAAQDDAAEGLRAKAETLGRAFAARGCVTLTGGTTGLPHAAGAVVIFNEDPGPLLGRCLEALKDSRGEEG